MMVSRGCGERDRVGPAVPGAAGGISALERSPEIPGVRVWLVLVVACVTGSWSLVCVLVAPPLSVPFLTFFMYAFIFSISLFYLTFVINPAPFARLIFSFSGDELNF